MSSEQETRERGEGFEPQTVYSPVLPAQDARQGVTGHNVRYVLGFGTVAIIVIFVVIWLIYFG